MRKINTLICLALTIACMSCQTSGSGSSATPDAGLPKPNLPDIALPDAGKQDMACPACPPEKVCEETCVPYEKVCEHTKAWESAMGSKLSQVVTTYNTLPCGEGVKWDTKRSMATFEYEIQGVRYFSPIMRLKTPMQQGWTIDDKVAISVVSCKDKTCEVKCWNLITPSPLCLEGPKEQTEDRH